jgi:hypothetical protein
MAGRKLAIEDSLRPMMTSPGTYLADCGLASTFIDNVGIIQNSIIAIVQKHRMVFVLFNFFFLLLLLLIYIHVWKGNTITYSFKT